eukprot:11263215-Alexandrium_andersonii.AAC.1
MLVKRCSLHGPAVESWHGAPGLVRSGCASAISIQGNWACGSCCRRGGIARQDCGRPQGMGLLR